FECSRDAGNRGVLLTDGYIDTDDRLTPFVKFFLIDDGVDGHGGLTGLAVADDQLALSASDGDHRVDGLDTGLQRLVYRLAVDHTRRFPLQGHFIQLAGERTFSVDGLSEGVDHTAHHTIAHADRGNATRALYGSTFANVLVVAKQHGAHVIFLEVEDET